MQTSSLTKFEVSRIVGLRALQLESGAPSQLLVQEECLNQDFIYLAAMELKQGLIDFKLNRIYPNNQVVQVNGKNLLLPNEVDRIIAIKRKKILN